MNGKFAPQVWERWLSTLDEAAREAAVERVAIMVVENEWQEWYARAVVMGVVVPASV